MKKRLGIIEWEFVPDYIEDLIKLCRQHDIKIDLFTYYKHSAYAKDVDNVYGLTKTYSAKKFKCKFPIEEEIKQIVNTDDYDYILTDSMGLSFTCNIFHNVSIIQKIAMVPNIFYRKLLHCKYKKQIEHEKNYYRNCPKTVVVSNYLKQDYVENCGVNPESIIVAYPGINSENLLNCQSHKNNKVFTLGAITCDFGLKGGYNILNALRILKKKYSSQQLRVRIINPNYTKQKVLQLYLKFFNLTKYVDLLPYQKDINEFYKTIDCLVCAGNYEAFDRIVPEGMLCSIPVIAGSNVGATDIIKDGENGFVFEAKEPAKSLAKKIEEVMSKKDNLEELIQNAQQTAKQINWTNFAESVFYGLYPGLR